MDRIGITVSTLERVPGIIALALRVCVSYCAGAADGASWSCDGGSSEFVLDGGPQLGVLWAIRIRIEIKLTHPVLFRCWVLVETTHIWYVSGVIGRLVLKTYHQCRWLRLRFELLNALSVLELWIALTLWHILFVNKACGTTISSVVLWLLFRGSLVLVDISLTIAVFCVPLTGISMSQPVACCVTSVFIHLYIILNF